MGRAGGPKWGVLAGQRAPGSDGAPPGAAAPVVQGHAWPGWWSYRQRGRPTHPQPPSTKGFVAAQQPQPQAATRSALALLQSESCPAWPRDRNLYSAPRLSSTGGPVGQAREEAAWPDVSDEAIHRVGGNDTVMLFRCRTATIPGISSRRVLSRLGVLPSATAEEKMERKN